MKETLENLELLISQDIFMTQTTALADVVFPGTSWGEHDGVFSASDRTFQRFTAAVPPKGECKHDWQIFSELSTRMGYPMHYEDTRDLGRDALMPVPELLRRHLREDGRRGPCQWPIPTLECPGTPTLYKNGQFNTADKKAILMAHDFVEPTRDARRRLSARAVHGARGGSLLVPFDDGNCKALAALADEPGYVSISPSTPTRAVSTRSSSCGSRRAVARCWRARRWTSASTTAPCT